jgi:hypothetical protein
LKKACVENALCQTIAIMFCVTNAESDLTKTKDDAGRGKEPKIRTSVLNAGRAARGSTVVKFAHSNNKNLRRAKERKELRRDCVLIVVNLRYQESLIAKSVTIKGGNLVGIFRMTTATHHGKKSRHYMITKMGNALTQVCRLLLEKMLTLTILFLSPKAGKTIYQICNGCTEKST